MTDHNDHDHGTHHLVSVHTRQGVTLDLTTHPSGHHHLVVGAPGEDGYITEITVCLEPSEADLLGMNFALAHEVRRTMTKGTVQDALGERLNGAVVNLGALLGNRIHGAEVATDEGSTDTPGGQYL